MKKEEELIKLYDKRIHIFRELELLLGKNKMSLIYELLLVSQKIKDFELDEEIEVLD